jgi:hypothetical protein
MTNLNINSQHSSGNCEQVAVTVCCEEEEEVLFLFIAVNGIRLSVTPIRSKKKLQADDATSALRFPKKIFHFYFRKDARKTKILYIKNKTKKLKILQK